MLGLAPALPAGGAWHENKSTPKPRERIFMASSTRETPHPAMFCHQALIQHVAYNRVSDGGIIGPVKSALHSLCAGEILPKPSETPLPPVHAAVSGIQGPDWEALSLAA